MTLFIIAMIYLKVTFIVSILLLNHVFVFHLYVRPAFYVKSIVWIFSPFLYSGEIKSSKDHISLLNMLHFKTTTMHDAACMHTTWQAFMPVWCTTEVGYL